MKKTISAVLSAILMIALASCGNSDNNSSQSSEYTFNDVYFPIKMTIPKSWSSNAYKDTAKEYCEKIAKEFEYSSLVGFENGPLENVYGDKGIRFKFCGSYYIGKKDISVIIEKFDRNKLIKLGKNFLYISNPPKTGFVYVNNKLLLTFNIGHWPQEGITKDISNFFGSLDFD